MPCCLVSRQWYTFALSFLLVAYVVLCQPGSVSAIGYHHRPLVPVPVLHCLQMMHTDCTVPYGEVDGFSALLGYQTANAAGCKVQTASIATLSMLLLNCDRPIVQGITRWLPA